MVEEFKVSVEATEHRLSTLSRSTESHPFLDTKNGIELFNEEELEIYQMCIDSENAIDIHE